MKTKWNLFQICLLGMVLLPAMVHPQPVIKVAAGDQHSLFLKSDGSAWGMGLTFSSIPKLIIGSNVTALAAGDYHSLFVKSDGSLWAMGDNNYGQLGDGTYNRASGPEQIVASNVTAVAAGEGFSRVLKKPCFSKTTIKIIGVFA